MLTVCWSVKGGSGTTVVAAALALQRRRRAAGGCLLVDLAGDASAALGLNEPENGQGVRDWLNAWPLGPEALDLLEVEVDERLSVLPAGGPATSSASRERWVALADRIGGDPRDVIVDLGSTAPPKGSGRELILSRASVSLLVLRPCYLAVRLAIVAPVRPTGIVLVAEENRSLSRSDIESALRAPVVAEVVVDAAVARAVDAGLLNTRVPRALERAIRHAA